MINKFIIHLQSNSLNGYYVGGKTQNQNGKIIPKLANSPYNFNVKVFPKKLDAIKIGKELLNNYILDGTVEVYNFSDMSLKYRANYIRGNLEREQNYE